MPLKRKKVEEVSEVVKETATSDEPVIEASTPSRMKKTIKQMIVSTELLNLRKSPDMNSEVLTRFVRNTTVDVEDVSNEWAHVVAPKAGYVKVEFLK
jgi:uncharacterized protein YgiM (DUF1202 family)